MALELIALSAGSLLAGLLLGVGLCHRHTRRDYAPVPEFDINNPMNARAARKIVDGGVEWTVYGGRR